MGYNLAKMKMKKNTFMLLLAFMVTGMLLPSAFAETNHQKSVSKQTTEIITSSSEIYNVSVYELKRGSGTMVIKKTIQAKYDAETGEIIIDGKRYYASRNSLYGNENAGTFGKYKYIVADKYYFNWEYEGNGRFRTEL